MEFSYKFLVTYFSIYRKVSKIIYYISSHLLNVHHECCVRDLFEGDTICLVKEKNLSSPFLSPSFLLHIHDVDTQFVYFSERCQKLLTGLYNHITYIPMCPTKSAKEKLGIINIYFV